MTDRTLLAATGNPHKLAELRRLLAPQWTVLGVGDVAGGREAAHTRDLDEVDAPE